MNIANNHFEPAGKKVKAGGQVVVNKNLKAGPPQHSRRLAPDITRPTNHKNFHVNSASALRFRARTTLEQ